ncbi:MAG TPA: gamma-glutamylcyclotransferase family protein [Chloroflexia bacterium]|nr:gamma-glutamylcyclotransferase family protein [Chloroflexia bacterium]
MSGSERLWYFAYGANMARAVLVRRGVHPSQSSAATLAGYALRFAHPGLPPLEPVFATVVPAAGATVQGVAHHITTTEAALFDSFEPGYHRVAVQVELVAGTLVPAFAYVSDEPGAAAVPSARYLGLLIDGAREYQLPAHFIAGLEALRGAASTASQGRLSTAALAGLHERALGAHLPADLVAEWLRDSAGSTE